MNERRVPYYPQQGYINYPNAQPMSYYNPTNAPTFNYNQGVALNGNNPPPPTTPYEQFAKPNHPSHWFQQPQQAQGQTWAQTPKGIMTYFQDKDGQIDIDKMLNTVGQMANTYQQVSPLVKGLGSFMKGFK